MGKQKLKIILSSEELEMGKLPINKIVNGHVLEVLKKFPSNSIDCVITSPPYWNKRDYSEEANVKWKDEWYGQLGLEPTPFVYIDLLIEVFREIKRILKPYGNVFIVIDDTYFGLVKWNTNINLYKDDLQEKRIIKHILKKKLFSTIFTHIKKKNFVFVGEEE